MSRTEPERLASERITKIAPVHVRFAVQAILVGQMASHLVAHQIDLDDPAAVREALLTVGHGEPSVEALLSRAIAAARDCR